MTEIGTWTWTDEDGQLHEIREWEYVENDRKHPFKITRVTRGWTMSGEEHEVTQDTERWVGPEDDVFTDYEPLITREQVGLHFQDLMDEEARRTL
ncbi:hypothetical protein [Microbacterium aurugineum]